MTQIKMGGGFKIPPLKVAGLGLSELKQDSADKKKEEEIKIEEQKKVE